MEGPDGSKLSVLGDLHQVDPEALEDLYQLDLDFQQDIQGTSTGKPGEQSPRKQGEPPPGSLGATK